MPAAVKYHCMAQNLGRGVHNLNANVLKIALSNTAPNVATHAVLGDVTEISAGNGYVSGGPTVASTAFSQTSGVGALTGTDVVITASGGSIGPFRYAILYDSTPTSPNKPLIQYWDYGSSITLNDTETFTVDFGTNILTES